MGEREQIVYMQVRIVRMYATAHDLTLAQAARAFDESGAFRYICDSWGLFHIEGDDVVLQDVESFMQTKGAVR
jgi:hypothetical protein